MPAARRCIGDLQCGEPPLKERGGGVCVGIEPRQNNWLACCRERGAKRPLDTCADAASACRAMLRHVARMMRQAGMGDIPAGPDATPTA